MRAPTSAPGLGVGSMLSAVGAVASVVNLGATIYYGHVTQKRLKKLEYGQDALLDGQDALLERQDALLEGQNVILNHLDAIPHLIRLHAEEVSLAFDEVGARLASIEEATDALGQTVAHASRDQWIAKVRSAQTDLVLAADMDETESRRCQRHAAMELGEAIAGLRLSLDREYPVAIEAIKERSGRGRLEITEQELRVAHGLREIAMVTSLRARLLVGLSQSDAATSLLRREAKWLRQRTEDLGVSMFDDGEIWDDLLNYEWRSHGVTADRLESWAHKFDSKNTGSLRAVIDLLQQRAGTTTLELVYKAEQALSMAEKRLDDARMEVVERKIEAVELTSIKAQDWMADWQGRIGTNNMSKSRKKRVRDAEKRARDAETRIRDAEKHVDEVEPQAKEEIAEASARLASAKQGCLTGVSQMVDWDPIDMPRTATFLLALEGLLEDTAVLEGHALEYEGIAGDGLSLQQHAARLRVRVEVEDTGSSHGANLEDEADCNEPSYVLIVDSNALNSELCADVNGE